MNPRPHTSMVLAVISLGLLALGTAFFLDLWGRPAVLPPVPLMNLQFLNTATVRTNLAALIRRGADISDFDCYACHEKKKPPVLRFDAHQNLIVPPEHGDIVMKHGQHNRNNNCFNCHDENNLEQLQTRDGRVLKLVESPPLCGSCHGPTYRDWEAGAHGRISGYWNRQLGPAQREDCVACHNPHAPAFPALKPAPGPHPLHPGAKPAAATARDS